MTVPADPITLLLVEDNPADVYFFKEALQETALPVKLYTVSDGGAAIEFLLRRGTFAGAPRPDVMVLDLNLPVLNGTELLAKVFVYQEFSSLPVVVLTTSASEESMCEDYSPGQCLYFIKTDDIHRLKEIIRQIVQHAASRVEGPPL